MSEEPAPQQLEIVVHTPERAWTRPLRALGRAARAGGRGGLTRLRRYLATPEGRRVAGRAAGVVLVAAAAGAGYGIVRGYVRAARRGMAAAASGVRFAAGALGTAARVARGGWFLYPLRLIWRSARWWSLAATLRLYGACPDCHARMHHDARVCWRCGYRLPSAPPRRWRLLPRPRVFRRVRTVLRAVRWGFRVATFRLYRPCPDCHRAVHAEARVCARCGYRFAPAPPD